MANWHELKDESVHAKADYVRDKLKEIEILINDVELYAEGNYLPGYFDSNTTQGAAIVCRSMLVNIKDVLIKQVYGDNHTSLESRKDYKERVNGKKEGK